VAAVAIAIFDKPSNTIDAVDPETFILLTSLVDKSLIHKAEEQGADGELRFRMLTVVRSFAAQQLSKELATALKQKLLTFYGQWHDPMWQTLGSPDEIVWTRRFQLAFKNLSMLVDRQQSQLPPSDSFYLATGRLLTFHKKWTSLGEMRSAFTLIERVLEEYADFPIKILRRLYPSAHVLAADLGLYDKAIFYLEKAIQLAEEQHDYGSMVAALDSLSAIHNRRSQPEAALEVLMRAQKILDAPDKTVHRRDYYQAGVNASIGISYYFLDDFAQAILYIERQIAYDRANDDSLNVASGVFNLSTILRAQQQFDASDTYLREALLIRQTARDWWGVMQCISSFANLAFDNGDTKRCVLLHATAAAWNAQHGYQPAPFEVVEIDARLAKSKVRVGEQAYLLAWRQGKNLSVEEACSVALS
jgi:tetratricopeptide (TPR) repeat protein